MRSPDNLEERVLAFCQREELLPQDGLVLAAVSGGADSMCLLTLLSHLAPQAGFTLAAAHYNHGLRGAEADRDETFVRSWCQREGIPCYCGRGDVAGQAAAQGKGIEETARAMRYAFLEETAARIGAVRIAAAHNAEDQAETLLLHLTRGSGLQGLTGMAPSRGKLIRPLLETSREEIEAYNRANNIPHVEDATNADLNYTRNYLRHQVIPLLKNVNPNVTQALGRTAESLRRDNGLLARQTEEALLPVVENTGEEVSLPAQALNGLPEALKLRGVQLLVSLLAEDVILSTVHRQAVVELAASENPSGQISLPDGLFARRQYDRLILSRRTEMPEPAPAEAWLSLPGTLCWGDWEISAQLEIYQGEAQRKFDFWLKLTGDRLLVRPRRTGDEFTPVGRRRKSVKRWMIEEKIPQGCREGIPVLEQSGKICGIPGLGADICAHLDRGDPAWHIITTNKRKDLSSWQN